MPYDADYSSVSLLLHCDGSNGSTTFSDNSPSPKTVTANGNAQVSTAQSKWGGASALFDGANDNLTVPNNAGFDFGSGDFTIECWFRLSAASSDQALLEYRASSAARGWVFYVNSSNFPTLLCGDSNTASWEVFLNSSTTVSADTWYHFAATRSGSTFRIFLDGTQVGSSTWAGTIDAGAATLYVGEGVGGSLDFNGYIDDIRITKGVARYTSGFSSPTEAFPDVGLTTGTGAVTYAGTASGSGAHGVAGTGAVTYSGTSSGTGSVTVFGSGDVTYTGIAAGSGSHSQPASGTGAISYTGTASGTGTYYRYMESLTDAADATDPSAISSTLYDAIRETLLCAADCDESANYNLSMSEAQAAIDTLIGGKLFQDAVSEVADGGVSTVVEIALRMVEQVAASDAALTSWQTAMTVAEVATALDLVAAGWAFSVVETAEANDTITPFVAMLATLLEEAVATDTLSNTLTVTVVSTETAAGADTVTTMAEFFETMDESVVAAVTLRLGDDVYTGWALNTEEGAVSEFQRYEFNSFCQLRGEYYAAGTDGIYRIGGSSDAGEAIVGYLKTGLLDFGSSLQKRMDSAWLAIATDGAVRMKVVTTDGGEAEETWYQVVSKDDGAVAENLRLKIGKGLKSRHWQFELVVEDASEFAMDELQLIPMILSRRT